MDYTRPIETGLTGWLPPVMSEKQNDFPVRGVLCLVPYAPSLPLTPPPFYSSVPHFFSSIDIGPLPPPYLL